MQLIPDFRQLIPSELKFTPATPGVDWGYVNTLVHGPGASDWERDHGKGDGNSAVFACLGTLSYSYPEPPLTVSRKDSNGKQTTLPRHPLQQLLSSPTPGHELTIEEILWWTSWARCVDGNAYWLKVRSGNERTGNVVQLWPISPNVMEPFSERDEWISAYRWQIRPNEYIYVPVENIIHFRYGIDDKDHRRGLSPLKRLLREISTDNEATKFTDALLHNYAVPGLVVVPAANMTVSQEDADRIATTLRRKFGTDNRGNIAVLSREASIQQFGFSPQELDMQALHRLPEERISAVLGVPAIVAGLGAGLDRATYSNFREAREMFTERTLIPMWRADQRKIATSLLPDFDSSDDLIVEFDITNVRALQEDEDKKYNRLNIGVQNHWITVNEARTDVGLPPVEGGDELTQPQPLALAQGDEEPPMEDEKRHPFGSTGRTIPEWKRFLLQLDPDDDEAEQQARMAQEEAAAEMIAEALRRQRQPLEEDDGPENVGAALLLLLLGTGIVREAIRSTLVGAADLGVAVAVQQFERLGYGFDWSRAATNGRRWANEYAGQLITNIDQTTRTQVQQAVGAWLENDKPLSALVDELAPIFGRQRAELIAATETSRAYNEGLQQAFRESGLVNLWEWRTSEDERVCPVCGPLHGRRAPIGQAIDGYNIPAHPRCRCWPLAVVEDGDDT
jgi:HK97 family phage portal protein